MKLVVYAIATWSMAVIDSKRWNSYQQLSPSGWCWMYSCSYITKETSALFPLLPHENVVEAFLEIVVLIFTFLVGVFIWWTGIDYWTTEMNHWTANTGLSQNAEFSVGKVQMCLFTQFLQSSCPIAFMVNSFQLVLHVTTACIWIWIWLNTEQAAATDVT